MPDRCWIVWKWPDTDSGELSNKVCFAASTKGACINELKYHVDDIESRKIGVSSYIVNGKYFVDQLAKATLEDPDMIKDWMANGSPMNEWSY